MARSFHDLSLPLVPCSLCNSFSLHLDPSKSVSEGSQALEPKPRCDDHDVHDGGCPSPHHGGHFPPTHDHDDARENDVFHDDVDDVDGAHDPASETSTPSPHVVDALERQRDLSQWQALRQQTRLRMTKILLPWSAPCTCQQEEKTVRS